MSKVSQGGDGSIFAFGYLPFWDHTFILLTLGQEDTSFIQYHILECKKNWHVCRLPDLLQADFICNGPLEDVDDKNV